MEQRVAFNHTGPVLAGLGTAMLLSAMARLAKAFSRHQTFLDDQGKIEKSQGRAMSNLLEAELDQVLPRDPEERTEALSGTLVSFERELAKLPTRTRHDVSNALRAMSFGPTRFVLTGAFTSAKRATPKQNRKMLSRLACSALSYRRNTRNLLRGVAASGYQSTTPNWVLSDQTGSFAAGARKAA